MHAADIHRHDHCHAALQVLLSSDAVLSLRAPLHPLAGGPNLAPRSMSQFTGVVICNPAGGRGLRAPEAGQGLRQGPEAQMGPRRRPDQACVQPAQCNLPVSCPMQVVSPGGVGGGLRQRGPQPPFKGLVSARRFRQHCQVKGSSSTTTRPGILQPKAGPHLHFLS